MAISPQASLLVFVMLAWTGGLINAVQTTMYALAAHVFPTSIRGTGVGTAVAFGRIGGVISPTLGGWALDTGGPARYFGIIAGTMTLALASLAAVRRHVPGIASVRTAQGVVVAPVRQ
jgi:AAHS family 4-hydroxybenzoate transporter-like MFS transporter